MTRHFDVLAFVGRFQPFHNGHLAQFLYGISRADRVVFCLGSANQPATLKNPWTASERQEMIESSIPAFDHNRVSFVRLWDMPGDDSGWSQQVREKIRQYVPDDGKVGMIGLEKDASSYYLKLFPEWPLITSPHPILNGTDIRNSYFDSSWDKWWRGLVPDEVAEYMRKWETTDTFRRLIMEK